MEFFGLFIVAFVVLLCVVIAVVVFVCEFVDWVDRKRFFSRRDLYIQDEEDVK